MSAALYNMAVQLAGIISANIYREDDLPDYRRGNTTLASIAGLNIVVYVVAKLYYHYRNKSKAKKWNALSEDEKQEYLNSTTDYGSKRLDFLFVS